MNILLDNFPRKVGVIGSGSIGIRHLATAKKLFPNCDLILLPSRPRQITNSIADYCCESIEELAALAPDFAIVASPASMHLNHSKQLLALGIPTLIEKPLTTSFEESKYLAEFAEHQNVKAKVAYCLRQLPSVQFVKQQLVEQSIGRIVSVTGKVAQYLPNWRPEKDYSTTVSAQKSLGGGVLLELSHELDLLSFFLGEQSALSAVLINSGSLKVDVEEIAHLVLQSEHGTIANIELNFLQQHTERYMVFNGERGTIRCDWLNNQVDVFSANGQQTFLPPVTWHDTNIYEQQLYQFIEFLNTGESNLPSIDEAAQVNRLIKDIHSIAKTMGS